MCYLRPSSIGIAGSSRRWRTSTGTSIAGIPDILLDQDGMVISIIFAPDDVDPGMPPWAPEFEERAANDLTQLEADELFNTDDTESDDG